MSDLAARAARYVAIPSLSGEEAALADVIESELRAVGDLEVHRVADNVVARSTGVHPQRVVIAGHLDTVPGDPTASTCTDESITGLGACDMKGSLAVMVALATSGEPATCERTWIFYANEEVGRDRSGLLELQRAAPSLLDGDVAVLGEPTSCVVEAGCQGNVRVALTLRGERAHTARPWRGRNAIHRIAAPLALVAGYQPREVSLDGVTYTEQLQAVGITGGVSGNVVPDEVTLTLNQRVAPDRTTATAIDVLRAMLAPFVEPGDDLVVIDAAEPAPPGLAHPMLRRLLESSGAPARAKLGYTDVSFFAARGMPAANFGAGDPEFAHHKDEFVPVADLHRCYEVLAGLLAGPPV